MQGQVQDEDRECQLNARQESSRGGFGAEPGQVQQGSGEGFGEGSGIDLVGFGAEPRQVQQGSGDSQARPTGFRRRFGRRFPRSFRRRFRKALVQSRPGSVQRGSGQGSSRLHVRCNRFGEGSGEGLGGFGAEPGQVQQGCGVSS